MNKVIEFKLLLQGNITLEDIEKALNEYYYASERPDFSFIEDSNQKTVGLLITKDD